MKRFLPILWLLFAVTAFASDVRLAWDANANPVGDNIWQVVRIYERVGTTTFTYTKVGEVSGTLTTATVANVASGSHTYIVRSFNGQLESIDSNAVSASIFASPASPTGLVITVVVK